MFVAVAKITLHLPENQSLKGKRQVLKPIIAKVQNQFNVAVAEVGSQDLWQKAEVGICCLSENHQHAEEMLAKVIDFVQDSRVDAEVTDVETESLCLF